MDDGLTRPLSDATQVVAGMRTLWRMNRVNPITSPVTEKAEPMSLGKATPIASLVRSKNIVKLWAVRMMVKLGAAQQFIGKLHPVGSGPSMECLQLIGLGSNEQTWDKAARVHWVQRLEMTLKVMEARVERYKWSHTVDANLRLLDATFRFSRAEKAIFVLAASLRANDALVEIAGNCRSQVDVTDQLHRILSLPLEQVRRAVSPTSTLRRSGLVNVSSGGDPVGNLDLQRGRLRCLVTTRLKSVDQLFGGQVGVANAPTLSVRDYGYLEPDVGFLESLMREALTSARRGVNVLLYGPPGTGKTELTRVVAQQVAVPLFEVSCTNDDGQPICPSSRLTRASTAQYLLKGRKALLVFDEVDAIFTDGGVLFGKPTTAEQSKSWVNELLERSPVPMFWIANAIWNMDPAFIRRFDVVMEMKAPPLPQRLTLLTRQCGMKLDAEQIRRIAQVEAVTPAVVTRAVSVLNRIEGYEEFRSGRLETLIDGTLKAQGHKTICQQVRAVPAEGYDPDLCNASVNLRELAAGVAMASAGRICLYGPPGTGKTAFGYWLADQLGKPLIIRRVSDIQSPMLGAMERNLAHAFEQASKDGAVLQIDEVDSFLRDRREARQGWEVSQVNEFLTQVESYNGVLIASTNMMQGLDRAAIRRFDYKVMLDYLLPDQRVAMLMGLLEELGLAGIVTASARSQLDQLPTLTPGDFAVLRRQHRITPFAGLDDILRSLTNQATEKEPLHPRRIGFV